MIIGTIPGSVGETSLIAILIGAAFLMITGIGSTRIILSTFIGGFLMASMFNWLAPMFIETKLFSLMDTPALLHLTIGSFAFGAVFMATDPVTAAQTNRGKIIYGLLIGVFAIVIRVFNPAYPEGMMLAILLMNVFAPLVDHYVIEANVQRRLKRLKFSYMNVNKNSYTFGFAIAMVVLVASLLSIAAISLKPFQDKNVELEKAKYIEFCWHKS